MFLSKLVALPKCHLHNGIFSSLLAGTFSRLRGPSWQCYSFSTVADTHLTPLSPLSSDDGLSTARVMLPDDANPAGNVHGGTILKMIEQAGFVVASRLCNRSRTSADAPPMMGTLAQISQMSFYLPMYVGELAKLYAKPQFKASGGIEVIVDVWAENVITGEIRHTNHAVLCYSAVHADTGVQLIPCNDLEQQLNAQSQMAPCCGHSAAVPSPPQPSSSFSVPVPEGPVRRVQDSVVNLAQVMLPGDCYRGKIVGGGVIMKLMDNASAVCAVKHCRSNVVTVSIDTLTFRGQVLLADIAHIKARMVFTSAKSMDIQVDVEVERLRTGERLPTTSGTFTFVSLDHNHRPKAVPQLLIQSHEEMHFYGIRAQKYAERKTSRKMPVASVSAPQTV